MTPSDLGNFWIGPGSKAVTKPDPKLVRQIIEAVELDLSRRRLGPSPPTTQELAAAQEKLRPLFDRALEEAKEAKEMGNFRIVIDAVGGHGCERKAKQGEKVYGCGRMDCPDCRARRFVEQLMDGRAAVQGSVKATFTHWPETETEVVDDLVTGERVKGEFKP